MYGVKRKRNTLELDNEKNEKKSVFRPSSILEDLSNELIYEIFDYLDCCEIYQIFFTLNARFQSLLTSSCFRFKLYLPFTSWPNILHRCSQIVKPNMNRIVSIYSSHCVTTDALLGLFLIDSFICLEALSLNAVETNIINSLLTRLAFLPRLWCLSISISDYLSNENEVYRSIFRLRALKYCKLKFSIGGDRIPLAYTSDEQDQCKTLEHLIINGACRLDQLSAILTYTPQLKYLSCRIQKGFGSTEIEIPILSTNLTHVSLDFRNISFNEFEMFLSKIGHHLKMLRVTTTGDMTFLRANLWERLILSHIPQLRVFDFLYRISAEEPSDDENPLLDLLLHDRFKSPFWLDRKWFFSYQDWLREGDDSSAVFYSNRPYRRKSYELYQDKNDDIDFKTVCDLTIGGRPMDGNRPFFFPNVTKLTLRESEIEKSYRFFRKIDSIIRLTQLNQLNIQDQRLSLTHLLQLLQCASNIQSLILSQVPCLEKQTAAIARFVRGLSKNNKITKLIIEDDCTLTDVQFFVKLCPLLQYFKMGIYGTQFNSILRFLMKNKAAKVHHLFALCIFNLPCDEMERIPILLDREKLLHDYFIQNSDPGLYLCW